MKRTRQVTVALVFALSGAAFGVAACSKSDDAKPLQPQSSEPVQAKPVMPTPTPTSVPAQAIDEEGPVATPTPKPTRSFADGEAAYRARKYADAVAIFEGYTERRPNNAWGHYMLALSAWKHGDLTKSELSFEKVLSIDPHHTKSLVNLSRVFIDQKRYDQAADRLSRASELEPESSDVFRLLGRSYAALHKTDEAVDAYRRAIELDERDAWSMNNLGLLLLESKRADQAVPLLANAVDLRKNVPEFHNNLGMALEHTGRFTAAATAYTDALTADPTYDKAKLNLARVEAVKRGPEQPFPAIK